MDDSRIRSKTAPFSFENGLVWTGPNTRLTLWRPIYGNKIITYFLGTVATGSFGLFLFLFRASGEAYRFSRQNCFVSSSGTFENNEQTSKEHIIPLLCLQDLAQSANRAGSLTVC